MSSLQCGKRSDQVAREARPVALHQRYSETSSDTRFRFKPNFVNANPAGACAVWRLRHRGTSFERAALL